MIYLLLGSKTFFIKKRKKKKKEKCDPLPPTIVIGLLGHDTEEGRVQCASPHGLSCSYSARNDRRPREDGEQTKPWEECEGLYHREGHWGLRCYRKKNSDELYIKC